MGASAQGDAEPPKLWIPSELIVAPAAQTSPSAAGPAAEPSISQVLPLSMIASVTAGSDDSGRITLREGMPPRVITSAPRRGVGVEQRQS